MPNERADITSVFSVVFWMSYTFANLVWLLILLIARPIIALYRRTR